MNIFWVQETATGHFFDLSLENILGWVALVAGWYFATTRQSKKLTEAAVKQAQFFSDHVSTVEKWIDLHEREAGERDKLIRELEKTSVELSTISKATEYRLRRLEQFDESRERGREKSQGQGE